jgi:SAM-dependent methyltransferase
MESRPASPRAAPGAAPGASDPDELYVELRRLQRSDCPDLLQFRSLVTANQYRTLADLARRWIEPASEVLDWGCGNGHFSYQLLRLGHHVTGFSFEDFPLRRHLQGSYRFVQGDASEPERLPFDAAAFDAVVSVGVLEHVRETGGTELASLQEIRRVLRPGGRFICYHFPNRYSWIEQLNRVVPGQHHHRYRYTRSDIEALCGQAGLRAREVGRYGALPRNLWHAAPQAVTNSRAVAKGWNLIDRGLASVLSPLCQNFYFVASRD